jgi:hypothetical protein
MKAEVGDELTVRGRKQGEERHGEIIEIEGENGAPPYVVRCGTAARACSSRLPARRSSTTPRARGNSRGREGGVPPPCAWRGPP